LVARAAARIVSGEGTIAGAAAEAGCCDQPHLNRLFRNEIGLTPGELRRLLAPRHLSKNPT
jgi:AraC-like DNA-binding protein